MADLSDPFVALCFTFEIDTDNDAYNLGVFTGCEGLGCEVSIEQREEGGNNAFVHQLPGRMKYSNIKLTRPVNRDSAKVAKWFARMGGKVPRVSASIIARRLDGTPVAVWNLLGVIPVKWQGPSLDVDSSKVAVETLEIAHHGFLP